MTEHGNLRMAVFGFCTTPGEQRYD